HPFSDIAKGLKVDLCLTGIGGDAVDIDVGNRGAAPDQPAAPGQKHIEFLEGAKRGLQICYFHVSWKLEEAELHRTGAVDTRSQRAGAPELPFASPQAICAVLAAELACFIGQIVKNDRGLGEA